MISRLFSSPFFRRLLCCLLALATVCLCLAPALAQPALALAGVDDATLAVGLLFCSWAGVTFATNQGAATAVGNFLNSSVNGLKACSEVASKYVVDGSLALVQGVKDAFNSILPELDSTFRTPEGSTDGALAGSIPVGVPLDVPTIPSTSKADSSDLQWFPLTGSPVFTYMSDGVTYQISLVIDGKSYYQVRSSSNSSYKPSHCVLSGYSASEIVSISYHIESNYLYTDFHTVYSSRPYLYCCGFYLGDFSDAAFELIGVEGYKNTFKKNPKVTGKEVTDLAFAQPSSPAPNPTDPTDPSETPDPSNPSTPSKDSILAGFKDPMFWGLMGMLGIIRNETGYDASKVDPEALIKQLQDLLNKTQTDPEPTPTEAPEPTEQPQPEPEPSEATKPTTSPDTPTDPPPSDSSPGFDDMKLPGLKDFFPFCIPFDLYAMMKALCVDPEAPKFTFATSFLGQIYTVEIDLSPWENVAVMVRYMVVAIYIVALAAATRKFIKW